MKKRLLLMLAILAMAFNASAEDYILYTSSDGNVVNPRDTAVFGAKYLSNTYANGQGKIIFDGEVTSIGYCAFDDCTNLTSVTIPGSVTSIGKSAFEGCTGLTSVTIPSSVTSIGVFAFTLCSSLPVENNLRYADTFLVEAVDKTQSTYTIRKGTKWIGQRAFAKCSDLTSVEIPDSVTLIGYGAFEDCRSLTSVEIPNSVTSIEDYTFSDCI